MNHSPKQIGEVLRPFLDRLRRHLEYLERCEVKRPLRPKPSKRRDDWYADQPWEELNESQEIVMGVRS